MCSESPLLSSNIIIMKKGGLKKERGLLESERGVKWVLYLKPTIRDTYMNQLRAWARIYDWLSWRGTGNKLYITVTNFMMTWLFLSMFKSGIICSNICSTLLQITWKDFILHDIWRNIYFHVSSKSIVLE